MKNFTTKIILYKRVEISNINNTKMVKKNMTVTYSIEKKKKASTTAVLSWILIRAKKIFFIMRLI